MNKNTKQVYERYIEEVIGGIKDYVRETKGENFDKYHSWKDTLEIVETFRVDMLALLDEIKQTPTETEQVENG